MTTAGRLAHQFATRYELDTRRALDAAIEQIHADGGGYEAVQTYLGRCAAAGCVLTPGSQFRDGAKRLEQPV